MRITIRHTFLSLVCLATLLSFTGKGIHRPVAPDGPADKMGALLSALNAGDASTLSRYFDNYVDLTLPDKRMVSYSRRQAMMVLSDFFDTNKVQHFNIQTENNGESGNYCVGTLQTSEGTFQVTLVVHREGEHMTIKEITVTYK